MPELLTTNTEVTISEDIIATVAGYAATENYGVVGHGRKDPPRMPY